MNHWLNRRAHAKYMYELDVHYQLVYHLGYKISDLVEMPMAYKEELLRKLKDSHGRS